MAVIGAILLVAAILAAILIFEGDEEDQGEDTGPDPKAMAYVVTVRSAA